MELFPTPFSLGTSPASPTSILPAVVHIDAQNSDKTTVSCQIGSVFYSNKNQSSLKDSNFATIIYNKITEDVIVIHKKPEFLGPCFNGNVVCLILRILRFFLPLSLDAEPEIVNDTKAVDRAALTNAFGSVRCQRMLKERERHADHRSAVTDATVITKAMQGQKRLKRESTDVDDREPGTEPAVDARVRLLPPFDLNAAYPQDVFPFDKLIPVRILEALASESELLSTAPVTNFQTWSEKGVYQKCVIDRLLRLSAVCNAGEAQNVANNRLRIAQCLAYLSHMLALFKLNPHEVHRKQPLPDSPPVVTKHLMTEFTAMVSRGDSSRFKIRQHHYFSCVCITWCLHCIAYTERITTMSPLLRDRLIYHMLALVLHCDNFKTVIDDLTIDFRMSCDQLRRYFIYMGCRVHKMEVSTGGEKVTRLRATLTTPVKFPDASLYRNRRANILD
ncbi:hypothetical protein PHET_01624 [Paragonimus heterotremus]|uniref:DNA-directed RNA polymerase I subunit RPA49 n=1 Tax=Paragonimus heterotremus TaxID=100268 RepID=A0A8J4T2K4_9TREM|nr:hypothetical protein PHET_01624 [Paragonimus heterotremus]